MRRDIEFSTKKSDAVINAEYKGVVYDLQWFDTSLGNNVLGEIDLPSSISEQEIFDKGLYVRIPYMPNYKVVKIAVVRIDEDGTRHILPNKYKTDIFFTAALDKGNGLKQNLKASELIAISESVYYIRFDHEYVCVYSPGESDLQITTAKHQNVNCMLLCNPGNYYRFPTTGVGLVRWINSPNINTSDLAEVLRSEFDNDGMIVEDAQYDYDTESLGLNIKEK